MKTVCWSGGFDSTLIVLELLSREEEFQTVYFDLDNNRDKSLAETRSRERIMAAVLERRGSDWRDQVVRIGNFNLAKTERDACLVQPYLWTYGLMQYRYIMDSDSMAFGWLKGSSYWHVKRDVEKSFRHGFRSVYFTGAPRFDYPLEWCSKETVAHRYSRLQDFDLLNMAWTCETPNVVGNKAVACGKRRPCVNKNKIRTFDESVTDIEIDMRK